MAIVLLSLPQTDMPRRIYPLGHVHSVFILDYFISTFLAVSSDRQIYTPGDIPDQAP